MKGQAKRAARDADPFGSHGTLLGQGKADMYNACEWGNYCRAGATHAGIRQVGRRAILAYGAILVRPDSPVYTAQQLAGRVVGVPFFAGTHYLALHMLEGLLPRDQIKVCRAPNGSRNRFNMMMQGEIEATTLTEPYISLASGGYFRTHQRRNRPRRSTLRIPMSLNMSEFEQNMEKAKG